MKRGKVPPMSAMNRLQLHEEDKDIKHQKLDLTELEGALIAKNIIFQKIYQLPKSRWTALKDRLINIPIMDDDIMNTIEQMPRTPQEAGLIGVALKRKKEYVNTHKHQLIDPSKLFRMLSKLKQKGNPHYQFYDDYHMYQARCKQSDPIGHDVLFDSDKNDDVQGNVEALNPNEIKEVLDEIETDEIQNEEEDEIEYETKDPVKTPVSLQ